MLSELEIFNLNKSKLATFEAFCNGNLGPGSGLILKSGTGTGTQIQNLRDLGLRPGLKFEKSGTRDWDRDASKNPGPEPGLTIFHPGPRF